MHLHIVSFIELGVEASPAGQDIAPGRLSARRSSSENEELDSEPNRAKTKPQSRAVVTLGSDVSTPRIIISNHALAHWRRVWMEIASRGGLGGRGRVS